MSDSTTDLPPLPCNDPGCIGCQDGEVCDYRNPSVRQNRCIEIANDEREFAKQQAYAYGVQKRKRRGD